MLVALIGQPNSGKSALLARLTGARVMTSNYPGTTVELLSGHIPNTRIEVLDTPGIYSLGAFTKEQEVTRAVLEEKGPDLVVDVVDGTNLARHLSLTLSLLPYEIPMVLAINFADRLRGSGLSVDSARLSAALGIPVVLTSATTGEGLRELLAVVLNHARRAQGQRGVVGPRRDLPPPDLRRLQREGRELAGSVLSPTAGPPSEHPGPSVPRASLKAAALTARWLNGQLDRPVGAYIGLGAGLIFAWKFMSWALPFADAAIRLLIGPVASRLGSLLLALMPGSPTSKTIAEAVSEGVILPLSTVLPAMVLAYALIALLEDSGLLSRYAALGDPLTGILGLPGQAIIPFMLGFGCRVPAILATRVLPGTKSRRNASILIAALVPCTATVSLSWATLARFGGNPLVPIGGLAVSAVGLAQSLRVTSRCAKEPLVLELPPLRMPTVSNVAMKTEMRLSGFFTHVLPLVTAVNVALRLLIAQGPVPGVGALSALSVKVLGIPFAALVGVLLTMLQRYLAPLFLMQLPLAPREATIAITMVVLGFPCLPSLTALWREEGPVAVVVTLLSSACLFLGWGMVLNLVLP